MLTDKIVFAKLKTGFGFSYFVGQSLADIQELINKMHQSSKWRKALEQVTEQEVENQLPTDKLNMYFEARRRILLKGDKTFFLGQI